MRILSASILGALIASALSGCCGACCCAYQWAPAPHSCNNPYECGSCNFWGVGHYMRQYGFLRRPCEPTCNLCEYVPADYVAPTQALGPEPSVAPPPPPAYDYEAPPPPAP